MKGERDNWNASGGGEEFSASSEAQLTRFVQRHTRQCDTHPSKCGAGRVVLQEQGRHTAVI